MLLDVYSRGLISAVEHFRFYLIGRKFLIRTDNKALSWLLRTTNEAVSAILFRWQQILQGYFFEVEFISGAKIKLADALSRKGYHDHDYGDMKPPFPSREPLWESGQKSVPPHLAKTSESDEHWLPVMKQKFEVHAINCSQDAAKLARGGDE